MNVKKNLYIIQVLDSRMFLLILKFCSSVKLLSDYIRYVDFTKVPMY